MKDDKLLIKTKHLDMYQTKQGFVYCQRRTINSIAALCFKKEDNQYYFLIRYQPLPEIKEKVDWKQPYACPITGSIEENESELESAIREVYEEGGIKVSNQNMVANSVAIATTQMNEKVFHYLFDVTNLQQVTPTNDGTIFESVSFNKWVTLKELESILEKDFCLSSLHICFSMFLKRINH